MPAFFKKRHSKNNSKSSATSSPKQQRNGTPTQNLSSFNVISSNMTSPESSPSAQRHVPTSPDDAYVSQPASYNNNAESMTTTPELSQGATMQNSSQNTPANQTPVNQQGPQGSRAPLTPADQTGFAAAAKAPQVQLRTPNSATKAAFKRISQDVTHTPWRRKRLYNSPFPRFSHTASSTTSDTGATYLMGGLCGKNVSGDMWVIEPVKQTGDEAAETGAYPYIASPIDNFDRMPSPRIGHACVLIGNAFIVFAGDTVTSLTQVLDNKLYFFNITSLKWTVTAPKGPRPAGRYGHQISVLNFEVPEEPGHWLSYLYVFGGQLEDEYYSDTWKFDLTNFRNPDTHWTQIEAPAKGSGSFVPPPIANHTMTAFENKLYAYGGNDGTTTYDDLLCFDPIKESWTKAELHGNRPPALQDHASTLYQNLLFIFGGKLASGEPSDDMYVIDLSNFNCWKIISDLEFAPSARSGHSLTADIVNERLLVMGGDVSDENFEGVFEQPNELIEESQFSYPSSVIYEFDLRLLPKFMEKSSRSHRSKTTNAETVPVKTGTASKTTATTTVNDKSLNDSDPHISESAVAGTGAAGAAAAVAGTAAAATAAAGSYSNNSSPRKSLHTVGTLGSASSEVNGTDKNGLPSMTSLASSHDQYMDAGETDGDVNADVVDIDGNDYSNAAAREATGLKQATAIKLDTSNIVSSTPKSIKVDSSLPDTPTEERKFNNPLQTPVSSEFSSDLKTPERASERPVLPNQNKSTPSATVTSTTTAGPPATDSTPASTSSSPKIGTGAVAAGAAVGAVGAVGAAALDSYKSKNKAAETTKGVDADLEETGYQVSDKVSSAKISLPTGGAAIDVGTDGTTSPSENTYSGNLSGSPVPDSPLPSIPTQSKGISTSTSKDRSYSPTGEDDKIKIENMKTMLHSLKQEMNDKVGQANDQIVQLEKEKEEAYRQLDESKLQLQNHSDSSKNYAQIEKENSSLKAQLQELQKELSLAKSASTAAPNEKSISTGSAVAGGAAAGAVGAGTAAAALSTRNKVQYENEILQLKNQNELLQDKLEKTGPYMKSEISKLQGLNDVVKQQQTTISELKSEIVSQADLQKEIVDWKSKYEQSQVELKKLKAISGPSANVGSGSADKSVTVGGTSADDSVTVLTSNVDKLLGDWSSVSAADLANKSISNDSMVESQKDATIKQLQAQVDELVKANNDDEQAKKELSSQNAKYLELESTYKKSVSSLNNTHKALTMSQQEIESLRAQNKKLSSQVDELRLRTPTTSSDATMSGTAANATSGSAKSVDEAEMDARYGFKIRDLEADLFIAAQERDKLREENNSLKKKLYTTSS